MGDILMRWMQSRSAALFWVTLLFVFLVASAVTAAPLTDFSSSRLTYDLITGQTLTVTGVQHISEPFNWTGGTITGTGTLFLDGGLTMGGTNLKIASGSVTIINTLETIWSGSGVEFRDSAVFRNAVGATFNVQTSGYSLSRTTGSTASFDNLGTVVGPSSTGYSATISLPLTNSGVIETAVGTLNITTLTSSGIMRGTGSTLQVTNLTLLNGARVENLTLNGATITVSGSTPVFDGASWNGGTITGTGTLTLAGTNTLGGGSLKTVSGSVTIVNTGTAAWTGSGVEFRDSGVFRNAVGATFNVQTSGYSLSRATGSTASFDNLGTVVGPSSTGYSATISLPFDNAGTVTSSVGVLALSGGGTGGGTFAGTTRFTGGTYTLTNGAVVSASVAGGTITTPDGATITTNGMTITSGTLLVNGAATYSGSLTWNGGTITGTGTLTLAGTNTLGGGSLKTVSGSVTIVNTGTAAWTGSGVEFQDSGVFRNAAGATFNVQTSGYSLNRVTGSTASFDNLGTVVGPSSTGYSATISLPLTNSGVIETAVGTLNITTLTSSGIMRGTGSTLQVTNLTLLNGARVENLTLNGATITVSGSTPVFDGVSWNGGTITGTGTLTLVGTNTLGGGSLKTVSGSVTIVNTGTAAWTGSGVEFRDSAVFRNAVGATFNIQTSGYSFSRLAGTTAYFDNLGTLSGPSSPGYTATFSLPVTSSGTTRVNAGTLNFTGGFTQTAGALILNGGAFSGSTFTLNGGTFSGAGTLTGAVINNGATVSPGASAGKITITGTYTQNAGGALTIEIGGTTAATGYDQLAVSGATTLNGTLNLSLINNFTPLVTDVFAVVMHGARTGTFATVNWANGSSGQVNYLTDRVNVSGIVGTGTPTNTFTPTQTPTSTRTSTSTFTPTRTASPTFTATSTPTATRTATVTATIITPTHTFTSTFTATPSPTGTLTATPTYTSTPSCVAQLELMLVLDISGSIGGNLPALKQFAVNLVNNFQVDALNTHVGLTSFESWAVLRQGLTGDKAAVINAINALSLGGSTAMGDGIAAGQADLAANGRASVRRVMIVLSDGYSNAGTDPLVQATNAKNAGTTIFSVAFGSGPDTGTLNAISSNGAAFVAADQAALLALVNSLAGTTCATPTPTFTFTPSSTPTQGTGSVQLMIVPAQTTVSVGQTFTLVVEVQAGTQQIDSAAAYLNFDPAKLEVVSITAGTTLTVPLANNFNNTLGTLDYAAGLLNGQKASGTFTLAAIQFRAKATAQPTLVTFNATDPRRTNVLLNGVEVLAGWSNGTVTIDNAALTVSVTLQGRPTPPHARWAVPLNARITANGGGNPVDLNVTTNQNGQFTVLGLANGSYSLRVKHNHALSCTVPFTLTTGANNVNAGTLREGDANNDDQVNITDFSLLAAAFGKSSSQIGYDTRTDFNDDAYVNITDFSLLAGNFGAVGGSCAAPSPLVESVGSVTLALLPPTRTVGVNDTFEQTIQVSAGSQLVDSIAVYLDFDPNLLEVVTVTPGTSLPVVLENAYVNAEGTLNLSVGILTGDRPSGTFTVGTVVFRAKALTAGTGITWHTALPRQSDVLYTGTSVLTGTMDAQIVVSDSVLSAPTLIAPTGTIAAPQPVFQWNTVNGATSYVITVNQLDGQWSFNGEVSAAEACSGSPCSLTLAEALQGGVYEWWVVARNTSADSSPSAALPFTVALAPIAPSQIAPVGAHESAPTQFQWNAVRGGYWYYVWLSSTGGYVMDRWYNAFDICANGLCSIPTPSDITLTAGDYQWWVQSWNPYGGYGTWSSAATFSIAGWGAPTQIAPTGVIITDQPAFQWNVVSGASWYHLWVATATTTVLDQWYEAASICVGSLCRVTPITVSYGPHQWWIQAFSSAAGYSPWSGSLTFSLPTRTPVPVSPTGTITVAQPEFVWQAVPEASWYYLWLSDDSGKILDQWYPSAVCGVDNLCRVTPLTLPAGNYRWWMQAWSEWGSYGTWSGQTDFTMAGSTPADATLEAVPEPILNITQPKLTLR